MVLAASAVILDGTGRVLLVRRGREPDKGRWSVPGGKVEPGETLQAAAAREAWEETGFLVDVGEELWSLTIPAGEGRVYEIHDFAATIIGGSLAPGDDADDARWVSGADLGDLPLTTDLESYLRRVGITR